MNNHSLNILILVLLWAQLSFSQSLTKRSFKNSSWFTSNKDSIFHKSDTLRFIKYSNTIEEIYDSYEESEYFDDSESIILKFYRKGYMNFYDKRFHMYTLSLEKWQLNKKDSILRIGNENEVKLLIKIISIKKIKFIKNKKEYETTEMLVVKK
jgi:hypothetical protein